MCLPLIVIRILTQQQDFNFLERRELEGVVNVGFGRVDSIFLAFLGHELLKRLEVWGFEFIGKDAMPVGRQSISTHWSDSLQSYMSIGQIVAVTDANTAAMDIP